MATYAYGRRLPMHPTDTKYIVHPHYATPLEASNEAIGHQVRLTNDSHWYFIWLQLKIPQVIGCDIKTFRANESFKLIDIDIGLLRNYEIGHLFFILIVRFILLQFWLFDCLHYIPWLNLFDIKSQYSLRNLHYKLII